MNGLSTSLRHSGLGLLVAALAGCTSSADPAADEKRPAPLVEAVEARFGALPIEHTVPVRLRARNQVTIRPEVGGRVEDVLVRSGASVRRGQPLVRLDSGELAEQLRQSEADVRLAEAAAGAAVARAAEIAARAERLRALDGEGLVSDQEMESIAAQWSSARAGAAESEARVEQARAEVAERRSALAKAVVRSPVDGRVGERRVEVGMQVNAGSELFVVGDLDELIAEVTLTEDALAEVEVGQPVLIETGRGEPVRGTLARISPFLSADSFTTVGEIDVDNRNGTLAPGMFVSARILVGESRRATLIPVSALREGPVTGSRGVFAIEEAADFANADLDSLEDRDEELAVTFRPVEVLAEGGGLAGVRGIEEGTWVVTVGQHLLAGDLAKTSGAGATTTVARVRPVSWERVASLQSLQNEDLLEDFLAKQRTLAAALGAEIPASESVVDQVLEEAKAAQPAGRS